MLGVWPLTVLVMIELFGFGLVTFMPRIVRPLYSATSPTERTCILAPKINAGSTYSRRSKLGADVRSPRLFRCVFHGKVLEKLYSWYYVVLGTSYDIQLVL